MTDQQTAQTRSAAEHRPGDPGGLRRARIAARPRGDRARQGRGHREGHQARQGRGRRRSPPASSSSSALVFLLHGFAWLAWYRARSPTTTFFWGFFIVAGVLFLLGALAGFLASRAFKAGAPPTPRAGHRRGQAHPRDRAVPAPGDDDLSRCRRTRTPEEIRASIEANRTELAHSLARLRGEVAEITDWRKQIAQPPEAGADRRRRRRLRHRRRHRRHRRALPPPPQVVLTLSEPVREALDAGGAVVALESTIIAHGLPRPRNLAVARELEDAVRAAGAVPATIAVLDGEPRIGLDEDELRAHRHDRHGQAQRPRPAAGRRARRRRRHHGGRHRAPGRARRDPRLRHRRPGRRASRRARVVGRVGRPARAGAARRSPSSPPG